MSPSPSQLEGPGFIILKFKFKLELESVPVPVPPLSIQVGTVSALNPARGRHWHASGDAGATGSATQAGTGSHGAA